MAFRWRIRNKLMVGLALVTGIIALLLAGTLHGLSSFRALIKSTDSKMAELREAQLLKEKIDGLRQAATRSNALEPLRRGLAEAREALTAYQSKLDDTLSHGRDPEKGFKEKKYVELLDGALGKLNSAVQQQGKVARTGSRTSNSALDDEEIAAPIRYLEQTVGDLILCLFQWQGSRIIDAKESCRTSLETVVGVSIGGVVLLCGLLRFFYGWVFYPIRDLEQGAGRVARGDFEFRIEVHSGDEMEDLATAFNEMTGRLSETYRDLEHQVNERSRQLVRSERLASVGFLAAGVAHEINNPLASIAFCSEALEERLLASRERKRPELEKDQKPEIKVWNEAAPQVSADDEIISKYLKMIQEEAFRCKAITQRLLEFSRGGERVREPVDLAKIVQAVVDMVEHLETSHGKKVQFEPARRVVAWVNAQEIKSVVLNLVVNSLESMDDGGELVITLSQRAGTAILEFADTGCGMTAETLENIFEPFYTRSRTGKGTGLGLSISHRVISQHGGEIEAVSPGLNQGSTFTVRLPLQPVEPVKEETLGHVAA